MRLARLIRGLRSGLAFTGALALTSCDGSDPLGVSATTITDIAEARALWDALGPREYSFVLERSCFCPDLRPVLVQVRDGAVRNVRHADDLTPLPLESSYAYPSLEGLFGIIEQAQVSAFTTHAEFDAVFGYPRVVAVDPWEGIADDGYGFVVSRVTRR